MATLEGTAAQRDVCLSDNEFALAQVSALLCMLPPPRLASSFYLINPALMAKCLVRQQLILLSGSSDGQTGK